MGFRQLFAAMVAITVLFAPTVARAGEAYAGPDHHSQMMQAGHCETGSTSEEDVAVAMNCCVAMCMAVAPASLAVSKPAALLSPMGSQPLASC